MAGTQRVPHPLWPAARSPSPWTTSRAISLASPRRRGSRDSSEGYHDGELERRSASAASTAMPGRYSPAPFRTRPTPIRPCWPAARASSLPCPVCSSARWGRRSLPAARYPLAFRSASIATITACAWNWALRASHVPIITGHDVEFYLGGDLVAMRPGECWYLNFDLPHRVQNLGATERVHLVIDCRANDWLRAMIASAAGPDVAPRSCGSSRRRGSSSFARVSSMIAP